MIKWLKRKEDSITDKIVETRGEVVATEDFLEELGLPKKVIESPERYFLWADEFEPIETSRVLNTMGHPSVWKFVPENYDHFVQ
jgi:hypothetical protein